MHRVARERFGLKGRETVFQGAYLDEVTTQLMGPAAGPYRERASRKA
jgi:hypothetical protein